MKRLLSVLRVAAVSAAACWLMSCDGGGGGGGGDSGTPDVGDNDVNTVVCIGDSITEGTCAPAGTPYPSRLAGLSGKNVVNAGVCSERSSDTAARAPGVMDRYKPGFLCVLIGANDATAGMSPEHVGENIRSIIRAAKARKIVPLVATLTPTYGEHKFSNDESIAISAQIRTVVKQEKARLVDLEAEFGTDAGLVQEDGLHPNNAGTQLIALSFNDKL